MPARGRGARLCSSPPCWWERAVPRMARRTRLRPASSSRWTPRAPAARSRAPSSGCRSSGTASAPTPGPPGGAAPACAPCSRRSWPAPAASPCASAATRRIRRGGTRAGGPVPRRSCRTSTPATLDAVAWLARGLRGPVTLDLNLPLGDPHNALALARAARRRLPLGSLETLEIGNEPDLYTRGRVFHVPGHVTSACASAPATTPGAYRRDVTAYLDLLSRRPPAPPPGSAVAGFAGARGGGRRSRLSCGRPPARVGALSAHLYALPRCARRRERAHSARGC